MVVAAASANRAARAAIEPAVEAEPEPEPEPSASTSSSEFKAQREVISLKSQLNAKKREILALKDELEGHERGVLDAKHKNRELQAQLSELEEKLQVLMTESPEVRV